LLEHLLQTPPRKKIARRVVGGRDQEDSGGSLSLNPEKGFDVVTVGGRLLEDRVFDRHTADLVRDRAVVPPGGARNEAAVAPPDPVMDGLLQEVLASVAEDDAFLGNAVQLRELPREFAVVAPLEVARVVEEQLRRRLLQDGEALRGRPVSVLVAIEKDRHHLVQKRSLTRMHSTPAITGRAYDAGASGFSCPHMAVSKT
jgi:hypothetical protein